MPPQLARSRPLVMARMAAQLPLEGVRDGAESGWASQPVPVTAALDRDMSIAAWPLHGARHGLVGPLACPLNQPGGEEAPERQGG